MIYIATLIVILFIGIFWLKRDPDEKIKREIQKKLAQATMYQRVGKLKEYAELIEEVQELEKKTKRTINVLDFFDQPVIL